MRSNFMRILCLYSGFLLGCVVQSEDSQEDEVYLVEEEEETPTVVKDSPKNPPKSEQEKKDEGFNPCPSDTYVILEKDGVKYMMVIQVFCDPIQNTLNLGCPEPY